MPHLCTCRLDESLEDGEMNEMTLPSRHRNLIPGGSEGEHATSLSRRLTTILNLYE